METVKKEHLDDFKGTILRDIKLQTAIKKMFRAMLILLVATMIIIGISLAFYLKQPTEKEKVLLRYLESERKYLQQSRHELIVMKQLMFKRDSIQLEEFKIMQHAFREMVNDEYIENSRKNRLK
jgi:hypothetical protein